jgi:hypothetical protein
VGIYLDALRGRGGDRAQAAACLLLFELLRQGDESREAELLALAPVLDGLMAEEAMVGDESTVVRLLDGHEALLLVWADLKRELLSRDRRVEAVSFPLFEALGDSADGIPIELDLFGDDDLKEIELDLDELDRLALSVDEEARVAFDAAFNALVPPPPTVLLSVDQASDLQRVHGLRDVCRSFSEKVGVAAELDALIELHIAAHSRGTSLLGRRNKERDRALQGGLERFAALPEPPALAALWLDPTEIPLAPVGAWPKVAEILLDYISFLGSLEPATAPPSLPQAYVKASRSKNPPPRLLTDGAERRRR